MKTKFTIISILLFIQVSIGYGQSSKDTLEFLADFSPGFSFWDSDEENCLLYFTAKGALWKTDGTASGTDSITPVRPQSLLAYDLVGPFNPKVVNGNLYYPGTDDEYGKELWMLDGKLEKTIRLTDDGENDRYNYPFIEDFVDFGDQLILSINDARWISDGTETGTHPLADSIYCDSTNHTSNVFFAHPNILYFTEVDKINNKTRLGIFDKNLDTISCEDSITNFFRTFSFAPYLDKLLYFSSSQSIYIGEGIIGQHLIFTMSGNRKIQTPYPSNQILCDGVLYFTVLNEDTQAFELWATDGTTEGTYMAVENIETQRFITCSNDLLYFTKPSPDESPRLWRTDGTEEGTFQIVKPGELSDRYLVKVHGNYEEHFYFAAYHDTEGLGYWKTDGTEEGTEFLFSFSTNVATFLPTFKHTSFGLFFGFRDGKLQRLKKAIPCRNEIDYLPDTIRVCGKNRLVLEDFEYGKNDWSLLNSTDGKGQLENLDKAILLTGNIGETYQLKLTLEKVNCSVLSDSAHVVFYADENACQQTVSTSNPFDTEVTFSLFPNPVNNTLTINYQLEDSSTQEQNWNLQITNVMGKQILERPLPQNEKANTIQQSFDDFPPGLYFVSISNGLMRKTQKVIRM